MIAEINRSRKRLTVKSKDQHINSLVILGTKNDSFHFFHDMDDFIFIEWARYGLALFYFYNEVFATEAAAQHEARRIVEMRY